MLFENIKNSLSWFDANAVAWAPFTPYCATQASVFPGLFIAQYVSIWALKLDVVGSIAYQNENATTNPKNNHMKAISALLCSFRSLKVPKD